MKKTARQYSQRVLGVIVCKPRRYEKSRFSTYISLSRKRYKIWVKLQWNRSRNDAIWWPSNPGLRVVQDRWKWRRSIDHNTTY